MKIKGFTLAELLLTLSIIGVVAALTLPTLNHNAMEAQIGPRLAKAVSVFEQANASLLAEQSADGIHETNFAANNTGYASNLARFIKGSPSGAVLNTKDGMNYTIAFSSNDITPVANTPNDPNQPAHNRYIGNVTINISTGTPEPSNGEQLFYFGLFDDGSLRPKGGALSWNNADETTWNTTCSNTSLSDRTYCAGHIFENNFNRDY